MLENKNRITATSIFKKILNGPKKMIYRVPGWIGEWMHVKAILRIASSNANPKVREHNLENFYYL
jgi:hypothetical protein